MDAVDPSEAAALGERFDLGRYESASSRKTYSPAREWGRRLRFVAIILPFILIAPVVATHSVVFGLVAALSVAGAWVAGSAMWRRARVLSTDRLLWFADGFAQLNADQHEPTVLRWPDATWFTVGLAESTESPVYYVISCTVGERSGRHVTLVRWQGQALAARADQVLAPRLALDLLRAFDTGDPVRFGRLGIDHAGLTDTRQDGAAPVFVSWQALRSITIEGRVKIVLQDHAGSRRYPIDLGGVPNAFLAWRVIEHAVASHQIQIRYTEDGLLPPRV